MHTISTRWPISQDSDERRSLAKDWVERTVKNMGEELIACEIVEAEDGCFELQALSTPTPDTSYVASVYVREIADRLWDGKMDASQAATALYTILGDDLASKLKAASASPLATEVALVYREALTGEGDEVRKALGETTEEDLRAEIGEADEEYVEEIDAPENHAELEPVAFDQD